MNNLLAGIFTIALCLIGYYYSWRAWRKDNYPLALILLIVCGLVLRVFTACDFFLHTWDERYHALVAKNLIHHPLAPTLYDNPILSYDYRSWVNNHVWLHKQPLPLWTMALSLSIFGINEIALRLPSIVLSTAGIWLSYSIASYFFNKKTAYITAFLFSINGLIIELAAGRFATDHIDIFLLFFVELTIYFSIQFATKAKGFYNILAGISIGLAVLSKWLPGLIGLPLWLLIVIGVNKFKQKEIILQAIILLLTTVVVFLPWQLYIHKQFPVEAAWESGFNYRHFTEVVENQAGPFYYYLDRIRINYGELIYLPLLWFLAQTIKNVRNYKRLAICVWFLVPLVIFSFAKTKMQGYVLFISPALFMVTAEFSFQHSGIRSLEFT